MTHTITLDPDTEAAIARKAARLKITPDEYLRRLAEKDAQSTTGIKAGTLSLLDQVKREFGLPKPRPGIGTTHWSEVESPFDTD